jgi:hypothetical protein
LNANRESNQTQQRNEKRFHRIFSLTYRYFAPAARHGLSFRKWKIDGEREDPTKSQSALRKFPEPLISNSSPPL